MGGCKVLRVMVREARPGMELARSLIHPRQPESLLVAAGYKLDATVIARLHELGVYDLWVHYPGLDFIDDMFSAELTTHQRRLCESIKLGFHAGLQRTSEKLPINQYHDVVQDLVQSLVGDVRHMKFMSEMSGVDDVLMRHSAEVCYLGVMIGLKIEQYLMMQRKRLVGYRAKDVVNLGIGCMLHDIGETQLPEAHRESRGEVSMGEDHWKEHVTLGYAMVQHQAEPSAANVVLNHHQHFDGSGFPGASTPGCGLAGMREAQSGERIHIFSRIATAADCFQHLLRHDGLNMPAVCALWKIQQKPYRDWIDPVVMEGLLSVVPPFLPGMAVKLSDKRDAVVTQTDAQTPCYPQVQVLNTLDPRGNLSSQREEINLATDCGITIRSVDGFDVSDYLYGARKRERTSTNARLAGAA
jgi:HD-GYP domain-containing protein (c-di-GMP phosphodiesterase class II)